MFLIRIKPEILQLATKLRHEYKMQNDQTISNKYSDDNSISVASEMNTINYTFAGSWRGFNGTRDYDGALHFYSTGWQIIHE